MSVGSAKRRKQSVLLIGKVKAYSNASDIRIGMIYLFCTSLPCGAIATEPHCLGRSFLKNPLVERSLEVWSLRDATCAFPSSKVALLPSGSHKLQFVRLI